MEPRNIHKTVLFPRFVSASNTCSAKKKYGGPLFRPGASIYMFVVVCDVFVSQRLKTLGDLHMRREIVYGCCTAVP